MTTTLIPETMPDLYITWAHDRLFTRYPWLGQCMAECEYDSEWFDELVMRLAEWLAQRDASRGVHRVSYSELP